MQVQPMNGVPTREYGHAFKVTVAAFNAQGQEPIKKSFAKKNQPFEQVHSKLATCS